MTCSRRQALQARAQAQKPAVADLEQGQNPALSSRQSEWAQQRNGPPHGRERARAGQQHAVFPGVEAGQQFGPIDGTFALAARHVDKVDGARPVEPPHQGDLAKAQRASAIEPDSQLSHATSLGLSARLRTGRS